MISQRPAWLTNALSSYRPATLADQLITGDVQPEHVREGDVRRLDPMDEMDVASRLVLVREVDPRLAVARVVLLTSEIDMATGGDVFLDHALTGLAYNLLAEIELEASVWLVQMPMKIGVVDLELLGADGHGPSIHDPADPRWTWKEAELKALMRLASECTRQLIDGMPVSIVDPACLDLRLNTWDVAIAAQAALRSCRAGRAVITADTVLGLAGTGHAAVGLTAAYTVLYDFTSRHPSRLYEPTAHVDSFTNSARTNIADTDGLATILADQLNEGRTCVYVLSIKSLWRRGDARASFPGGGDVFEAQVNGRRCQVVALAADELEAAYA